MNDRLRQVAVWVGVSGIEAMSDARLWKALRARMDALDPAWWPADPRQAWSKLRGLLPDRDT